MFEIGAVPVVCHKYDINSVCHQEKLRAKNPTSERGKSGQTTQVKWHTEKEAGRGKSH